MKKNIIIRIITAIAFIVALSLTITTIIGIFRKIEVKNFDRDKTSWEERSSPEELARCAVMREAFREILTLPEGSTVTYDYVTSGQRSGEGYVSFYHYMVKHSDGSQSVGVLAGDSLVSLCVAAYYDGLIKTFPSLKWTGAYYWFDNTQLVTVSPEEASSYEFVNAEFVGDP